MFVSLIKTFFDTDNGGKRRFKVGLFHNERLIRIPGCEEEVDGGGLWCNFDKLKQLFNETLSNCELSTLCATNVTLNDTDATADDRF